MGKDQSKIQFDSEGWVKIRDPANRTIYSRFDPTSKIYSYEYVGLTPLAFKKAKRSVDLRKNSESVVKALYQNTKLDAESKTKNIEIFVEQIPLTLENLRDVPFHDTLHIYRQSLLGAKELTNLSGPFLVEQKHIGINMQGKVKIYHNSNHGQLNPEFPTQSQSQMVRSIFKAIKPIQDQESFVEYMNKKGSVFSRKTFEDFMFENSQQISVVNALQRLEKYQTVYGIESISDHLLSSQRVGVRNIRHIIDARRSQSHYAKPLSAPLHNSYVSKTNFSQEKKLSSSFLATTKQVTNQKINRSIAPTSDRQIVRDSTQIQKSLIFNQKPLVSQSLFIPMIQQRKVIERQIEMQKPHSVMIPQKTKNNEQAVIELRNLKHSQIISAHKNIKVTFTYESPKIQTARTQEIKSNPIKSEQSIENKISSEKNTASEKSIEKKVDFGRNVSEGTYKAKYSAQSPISEQQYSVEKGEEMIERKTGYKSFGQYQKLNEQENSSLLYQGLQEDKKTIQYKSSEIKEFEKPSISQYESKYEWKKDEPKASYETFSFDYKSDKNISKNSFKEEKKPNMKEGGTSEDFLAELKAMSNSFQKKSSISSGYSSKYVPKYSIEKAPEKKDNNPDKNQDQDKEQPFEEPYSNFEKKYMNELGNIAKSYSESEKSQGERNQRGISSYNSQKYFDRESHEKTEKFGLNQEEVGKKTEQERRKLDEGLELKYSLMEKPQNNQEYTVAWDPQILADLKNIS